MRPPLPELPANWPADWPLNWPDPLREIVLAGTDGAVAASRLQFFRQVTADLWSGSGADDLVLAALVMRAFGKLAPDMVARRLPSLRVEAASRVRAAQSAARGIRAGSGVVEAGSSDPSHAGFFALDVVQFRHGRFDGAISPWLTREIFVVGDAVTVLPYDPVRDRVLLIEQVRVGPMGRGDPLPWQLEAIAGRIDPGETPEAAARREAVEEADLSLGELVKVAEYYPSPGAVAEYIYSFVALCDLPDGVAGVFGAAEEAEDIKGHLMSFDRLVEVMAAGEIGNAPLLLTALWLQRERSRLRR